MKRHKRKLNVVIVAGRTKLRLRSKPAARDGGAA